MTLMVGSFTEGFRSPHLQEDDATAEVFQKAINGKNGRERCCHAVKILIRRARILPDKEQECIQFLIKVAKQCGTENIVEALSNFGINHPKTKGLCTRFIAEVCSAS